MFKRSAEALLEGYLKSDEKKIFFLWGPRRSGKTTLLRQLERTYGYPLFNFDLQSDAEKFAPRREALSRLAALGPVILIDEVQNAPETIKALKVLHDEYKVKIIATGSSELRQKTQDFDSLAGRFIEHYCYPLSTDELRLSMTVKPAEEEDWYQSVAHDMQIYGGYPEVLSTPISQRKEREDLLRSIVETYILKDIVNIYDLRNSKIAYDLLRKIALQIGSEVSLRELANSLSTSAQTIANYLQIFVKNHVLIALPSFKTNMRRAISEHKKYYFHDLGVRNALIDDFRELHLRNDQGHVFENFVISEVNKVLLNENIHRNLYFYREYSGAEVDLIIEDSEKTYLGVEFKLSAPKKPMKTIFPLPHEQLLITPGNYHRLLEHLRRPFPLTNHA